MKSRYYWTTRLVFTVTLIVAVLTISGVWLLGLDQSRSIYYNSLLSTAILSVAFFLFLTIGLYKGVKLKDDIGKLTDKINLAKIPGSGGLADIGINMDTSGDNIGEIILSIVFWLVMTFLLILFFWLFGMVLWTVTIAFVAMLYWVFFRAVRLVFKKSNKCKANLSQSVVYGLSYTLLYTGWIFGIIWGSRHLIH